jgi:hypothetical protein
MNLIVLAEELPLIESLKKTTKKYLIVLAAERFFLTESKKSDTQEPDSVAES